jgi:hypothetical protein
MQIDKIRAIIKSGFYNFSDHAVKRMIKRSIFRHEIEEALLQGEIIEDYPDDKYTPSCLVYGKTQTGRNLHIHVTLPPEVVIITSYEPDLEEWINFKIRRF